jgi:hypothetical protein
VIRELCGDLGCTFAISLLDSLGDAPMNLDAVAFR